VVELGSPGPLADPRAPRKTVPPLLSVRSAGPWFLPPLAGGPTESRMSVALRWVLPVSGFRGPLLLQKCGETPALPVAARGCCVGDPLWGEGGGRPLRAAHSRCIGQSDVPKLSASFQAWNKLLAFFRARKAAPPAPAWSVVYRREDSPRRKARQRVDRRATEQPQDRTVLGEPVRNQFTTNFVRNRGFRF
jgi:hypothetical protein